MIMTDSIKELTLKELIGTGVLCSVCLIGDKGGFTLKFECGSMSKTLSSARGKLRKFGNLNTAVDYLRQLGISKFQVDATSYQPGRLRNARPDRAKALRNTRTNPRQQELLP